MWVSPASAQLSDGTTISSGVTDRADTTSTPFRSEVWDIERIGNVMYVGGAFTRVSDSNTSISQAYLAAFAADSGRYLPGFSPNLDGAVFALQASSDGSRLFVGGEFSQVNGQVQGGLVALDPTTGATDGRWKVAVSGARGAVRALETQGRWVYAAGRFTQVDFDAGSLSVSNAIRVDQGSGSVDSVWRPRVSGGIWGVAASPSTNRVYLAGTFSRVAGRDFEGFVATNDADGAALEGIRVPYTDVRSRTHIMQSVLVVNGLVFVGGSQHTTLVYRESDWTLLHHHLTRTGDANAASTVTAGGDTQDIELHNGLVYVACHCFGQVFSDTSLITYYTADGLRPFPTTTNTRPVNGIYALNPSTGERVDNFAPRLTGIGGPWALKGNPNDGCLWTGGNISRVAGQDVDNLVRYCANGVIPARPTPPTPAPPTPCLPPRWRTLRWG